MTTSHSQQTIEVEAESLDEARNKIESQIPQGLSIRSENIISDGKPKTAKGIAETMEEAYAKAQNEVPKDANILGKKELAHPDRKVVMVEAVGEHTAKVRAKNESGSTAIIKAIKLVTPGSKGFLGIWKKPNQYEVEVLHQAIVEITYTTKPKIVAKIGKAEAKFNEHYMLKCMDCSFTHHIPGDVEDYPVAFCVDVDEVKMICVYGGAFRVTLGVKEFFTITKVPGSGKVLHASIGDNMKALHSHMLSHWIRYF